MAYGAKGSRLNYSESSHTSAANFSLHRYSKGALIGDCAPNFDFIIIIGLGTVSAMRLPVFFLL